MAKFTVRLVYVNGNPAEIPVETENTGPDLTLEQYADVMSSSLMDDTEVLQFKPWGLDGAILLVPVRSVLLLTVTDRATTA